jgi:hypothetical protein
MQCFPWATFALKRHYYTLAPWGESHIFTQGILNPQEHVIVSLGRCITTQSKVYVGKCCHVPKEMMVSPSGKCLCFLREMCSSPWGNDGVYST